MPERFIGAAIRADQAGTGIEGYNLSRREFFQCASFLMPALERCARFRTLEEHTQHLIESGVVDVDWSIAEGLLKQLRERGLLISEYEFLDCIQEQGARGARPGSVDALYIPTRNRADTALRCLASHASATRDQVEFRILDDSDTLKSETLRTKASETAESLGVRVSFAGADEKEDYLGALFRQTKADEGLRSALLTVLGDPFSLPFRMGVNRNWMLLDSVGEVAASADDDTLAEATQFSGTMARSAFSSHVDPTSLVSYDNWEGLDHHHEFSATDPIAVHEGLLGLSLRDFVQDGTAEQQYPDVDEMSVQFVQRALSEKCVIRATAFGQGGDPGRQGLGFILGAEGDTRDAYFKDQGTFLSGLTASHVVRHCPAQTVTDSTFFMTTHAGFDNREILPPFFPVGHNDDGVFVEMLLALDHNALVGQLPLAIHHAPPGDRSVNLRDVKQVVPNMSAFVGLIFQEFRQLPVDESVRDACVRAGALFTSIGSLSDRDFSHLLKLHWNRFLSGQFTTYSELLDRYGAKPAFWAEQVEDVLDGIERQLNSDGFPVPVEIAQSEHTEDSLAVTKRLFMDYGIVLSHWPMIWDAALKLKGKGVRPTVRIT